MSQLQFDFSKKFTKQVLKQFSHTLQEMQQGISFKVSSRGWCYLMEQAGYINKSQFNKVDMAINRCRKEGYLPVDFVAEEAARAFAGVEEPSGGTVMDTLEWMLRDVLNGAKYFTPDWWEGEEYYIQILVEKIDLKTLFTPICQKFKIPIANAKGWSSILQRAEYARRFKEAEDAGLKCVLLYCGDHDPDGLRISDTIRKNLYDLQDIQWGDGVDGYDPSNLTIERFGLNYDFIIANQYTWIDNLITGSGMNLASPDHKNYKLPYVKSYLKEIGERKCEANAIVTTPTKAEELITQEIQRWLGEDALERFAKKVERVQQEYNTVLEETDLITPINKILNR
jgi:hypothetical protein